MEQNNTNKQLIHNSLISTLIILSITVVVLFGEKKMKPVRKNKLELAFKAGWAQGVLTQQGNELSNADDIYRFYRIDSMEFANDVLGD